MALISALPLICVTLASLTFNSLPLHVHCGHQNTLNCLLAIKKQNLTHACSFDTAALGAWPSKMLGKIISLDQCIDLYIKRAR